MKIDGIIRNLNEEEAQYITFTIRTYIIMLHVIFKLGYNPMCCSAEFYIIIFMNFTKYLF